MLKGGTVMFMVDVGCASIRTLLEESNEKEREKTG